MEKVWFKSGSGIRKSYPDLKLGRLNPDPNLDPDLAIPRVMYMKEKEKMKKKME